MDDETLYFTDKAKERIRAFLDAQQAQGVSALRVAGTQAEPKLWLMREDDTQPDDVVFAVTFDGGGFKVYMDPLSAQHLTGATVDFVESVMSSGFRVFFPSPTWDDPLAQAVQDVLDAQINPGIASHGGKVSLAGVEGDAAIITLNGGCQGCGMADVTLKQGIEVMIKEAVPEIHRVIDRTDHASGANPYYQPSKGSGQSPLARD
jgi:Fe/S biogenesis protein NfuA